jgi:hypothetical protein
MAAKLTILTHKAAPSGREPYYLQFSLQEASPETFGYNFVHLSDIGYIKPNINLIAVYKANSVWQD